jgi:transposase
MIPSGVKVFLASQPVDFRKGPDGLVGLVRDAGADPFNGSLYVFRAKRADRIKIVWWDGRACAFTPSGWRRRRSVGRGSATAGCS